jgi:hypothetical protein
MSTSLFSVKSSRTIFDPNKPKFEVVSRSAGLFYNAVRGFALGMQASSFGCKSRVCIRFQEAAYRTTEGTYRNAFFLWYFRNSPESFIRCSLNPVDDSTQASVLPVEDEPLHHLAVALGTPNRFRIHAQTPGERIGRS